MPAGMLLKSTPAASTIDAPQPGHTLADYCARDGRAAAYASDGTSSPSRRSSGTGSGSSSGWCPSWSRSGWSSVDRRDGGFELKLDSGEQFARAGGGRGHRAERAGAPAAGAGRRDPGRARPPPGRSRTVRSTTTCAGSPAARWSWSAPGSRRWRARCCWPRRARRRCGWWRAGRGAVGFGAPPDRQPRLRPRVAVRPRLVAVRADVPRRCLPPAAGARPAVSGAAGARPAGRVVAAGPVRGPGAGDRRGGGSYGPRSRDGRPVLALRGADGQGGELVGRPCAGRDGVPDGSGRAGLPRARSCAPAS